jgi:hypothetical protein
MMHWNCRRHQFISLFGGAVAVWNSLQHAAVAQQAVIPISGSDDSR